MAETGAFVAGAIVSKLLLDGSQFKASVGEAISQTEKLNGMSPKLAAGFRTAGMVMTAAGGAALLAIKSLVKSTNEQIEVETQLNAVLKSTQGAAGMTAKSCKDLASALQAQTTYGDEAILSAENLLLTFTSIGKDVFPSATEIVLDMATALKQDLKQSAIQVGKALQDPVLGVTALRRVGVNFSADQVKLIKTLVDTGDALGAQKFILAELAKEFGGSARAQAKTFQGQVDQLRGYIVDLKQEIGMALIPVLLNLVQKIKPIVQDIIKWVQEHKKLVAAIAEGTLKFGALMAVLGPILIILPKLVAGFSALKTAGGAAANLLKGQFTDLGKSVSGVSGLLGKLPAIGIAAFAGWKIGKIIGEIGGLNDAIEKSWAKVFKWVGIIKEAKSQIGDGWEQRAATRQEIIDKAFELSGKKAFNYTQALDVLEKQYEKTGTTGSEKLDEIIKKHIGADASSNKLKKSVLDLGGSFEDAGKKADKKTAALKTQTSIETTAIPKTRQLIGVLEQAVPAFTNVAFRVQNMNMVLDKAPEKFDEIAYSMQDIPSTASDVVTETSGFFDGLFNDIASGFGDTIQGWVTGAKSLKTTLEDVWKNVKDSFFRMVGQMTTEWTLKFLKSLTTDTANAATKAAKSITSTIGGSLKGLADTAGKMAGGFLSALGSVGSIISGITSLIDLLKGPQKQTDVTYWLKMIQEQTKEARDWLFINAQEKLDFLIVKLEDIKTVMTVNMEEKLKAIVDAAQLGNEQLQNIYQVIHKWLPDISAKLESKGGEKRGPSLPVSPIAPVITGTNTPRQSYTVNINFDVKAYDSEDVRRFIEQKAKAALKRTIQKMFDGRQLRVPNYSVGK